MLADWVEAVLSSDPYFRKLVRRERPTRLFLDTTWAPCCPSARLKCFEDCDVGVAKARALATLLHRSLPDASKNWAEVVDVAAVMFNGRLYYPGEAPDNPVEASDLLEAALWGHPDNPRVSAACRACARCRANPPACSAQPGARPCGRCRAGRSGLLPACPALCCTHASRAAGRNGPAASRRGRSCPVHTHPACQCRLTRLS